MDNTMGFKSFLIESYGRGRQAITYQKLLQNLDSAHISRGENFYEFNLGSVVRDSKLKGLDVRIEVSEHESVKLGRSRKSGKFTIVVFVTELPSRLEIDNKFETDKQLMDAFLNELQNYSDNHRDDTEEYDPSKEELDGKFDGDDTFEEKYDELISAVDKIVESYTNEAAKMEKAAAITLNQVKKATIGAALSKLRDDSVGSSAKDFVKIVLRMPEAAYAEHLDKDAARKLQRRLENYYEQKISR